MNRRFVLILLLAIASHPLLRAHAFESPSDRLRIAGIVLKWIRTDREANFARFEPLLRTAAAGGAQIVCTTECFLDGYAIEDKTIPLEEYRAKKNDGFLQRRSRENGKYIFFTHPAEFLVTTPEGDIPQRVLLGENLKLDDQDIDTAEDSRGVFFFDLQRSAGPRRASPVSHALSQPLLKSGRSKEELRTYCAARIPAVETPSSAEEWLKQATRLREQLLGSVIFRGEAQRWRNTETKVEWFGTIKDGDGYLIRKFRYEALPGFWIPALLYEPTNLTGAAPVVINVNGHHRGGKAMPYKQRRCINLARRGILAYSLEFIDMGQLRHRDNKHNLLVQLDLCGTSGVAVFHLALKRGLDVALSHKHADPQRVGVAGLSGGGWQSIWLAALDTRITLANPVAGYCSIFERLRDDSNIGDAEQIPSDLCRVADYTHLTAMVAPRPLLLTYNDRDDCCFLPDQVLERLETVGRDIYGLCDVAENFETHINHDPGTHNFDRDNREALYRFVHRHLLDRETAQQPVDLPVNDAEIKTGEELAVPMPERNATLHDLALQISQTLPNDAAEPADEQEATPSCDTRRKRLKEIVRQPDYKASAELVEHFDDSGLSIFHWRLQLDDDWTLPAVEFRPRDASGTCILVSDWGKQSMTPDVERLLAAGKRVIAVDLLGFGESDPGSGPRSHNDVMLMLIATVGDRPLGIQAAQLTAVAQWATGNSVEQTPKIIAVGPRNSVIALIAAALEPGVTSGLALRQAWKSLREIIHKNLAAENAPEQFCFGLLKEFDVPQLVALAGPQPVVFGDPTGSGK